MSEHTKGRLHQCSHSDKRLRDEGGEWVADTDTARRKQKECSANARRLAAAWNACEGMTTEAIEALDGGQHLVGSTTQLTVHGFSDFLEQVYAFGASLGVSFSANPKEGAQ